MATKDHCLLWIPESSAPYRRLRKPRTYSIAVPEAPTGINFIGPTDNAEVHILWRAVRLNKLLKRAESSKLADQRSPAHSTSMRARAGTP